MLKFIKSLVLLTIMMSILLLGATDFFGKEYQQYQNIAAIAYNFYAILHLIFGAILVGVAFLEYKGILIEDWSMAFRMLLSIIILTTVLIITYQAGWTFTAFATFTVIFGLLANLKLRRIW